jgi:hypothetical protein
VKKGKKWAIGAGVAVVLLAGFGGCGHSSDTQAPAVANVTSENTTASKPQPPKKETAPVNTPAPAPTVDPNKQFIDDMQTVSTSLVDGFTTFGNDLSKDATSGDFTSAELDTETLIAQVDDVIKQISNDHPTGQYKQIQTKFLHVMNEYKSALKKFDTSIKNQNVSGMLDAEKDMQKANADMTSLASEIKG